MSRPAIVIAAAVFCVGLGVVAHTAPGRAALGAANATRTIYFSARGADGTPVRDLTAADLSLTAMGQRWPIVRLEKATAPIDVSVILDSIGRFGASTMTDHLVEFLRQTLTSGTVSVQALGHGPSKLVGSSDPKALESAILELGVRAVPGRTYLADAVDASAQELRRRRSARPVILVVTGAGERLQIDSPGANYGGRDYAGGEHAAMADAALNSLRRSGAILEVVCAWNGFNVGQVLGSGSAKSGGIIAFDYDNGLQTVRETLLSQYQLVYSVLDGYRADDRIVLRTDRPGVKIIAPTTAAR